MKKEEADALVMPVSILHHGGSQMKFAYYPNLGEAIPRRSKIGLLIFNYAFFIGESDKIGVQIVICSMQHDSCVKDGWRRTWFKVVRYLGA